MIGCGVLYQRLASPCAVVLAACAAVAAAAEPLSDADRRALFELQEESRVAVLEGDAVRAAALFEEDAVLLPPGAPAVEGRAAIEAFWRSGPALEQFAIRVLEAGGEGDFAFVRGEYTMLPAGVTESAPALQGKFLQVLRRDAGRRWRIRADMFSLDSR